MTSGEHLGKLAYEWWGSIGVPVFPCSETKRPLTTNGFKDASTEEAEILRMFRQAGDRAVMIGAAMGERARLFALDLDLYKGSGADEYKNILESQHLLKPTLISKTINGGLHYIYSVPDGMASPRNAAPYDGVEIRGEGGYIIVPPTEGYEFQNDASISVSEPNLVTRLLRHDKAFNKQNVAKLKMLITSAQSFHEALNLLAAKLHGRGDRDIGEINKELIEVMQGSVAADPNHRRHRRWLDIMEGKSEELVRISNSAYVKFNAKSKGDLKDAVRDADEKKPTLREELALRLFGQPPGAGSPLKEIGEEDEETPPLEDSGEQDMEQGGDDFPFKRYYQASRVGELPTRPFQLYPLITKGDVVLISADPKAGKTMMAATIAMHCAAGLPIGDTLKPLNDEGQTAHIPTIYAALEGQGTVRQRVAAWVKEQDIDLSKMPMHVLEESLNLGDADRRQDFVDKIVLANAYYKRNFASPLGMIFLDTLTKLMPGRDQNSVDDTSEVFETIDMLKEAGVDATIVFIHHNNRQTKGPRGSSNILAEPDTLLYAKPGADLVINGARRRSFELGVYMARSIDDEQRYTFAAKDVELGLNSQGIMITAPMLECVSNNSVNAPTSAEEQIKEKLMNVRNKMFEAVKVFLEVNAPASGEDLHNYLNDADILGDFHAEYLMRVRGKDVTEVLRETLTKDVPEEYNIFGYDDGFFIR